MATYMGRDTSKLKAKGGKWKYMSEAEMLSIASGFSPYRCVHLRFLSRPSAAVRATRVVLLADTMLMSSRSLFMWYMWRIEDVDISVMQTT
jgi:DNA-3-methyladenine glycosylase II